jgi:hypothetical protein
LTSSLPGHPLQSNGPFLKIQPNTGLHEMGILGILNPHDFKASWIKMIQIDCVLGDIHWEDLKKQWVATSKVRLMAIIQWNWHLGKIPLHHWELSTVSARWCFLCRVMP